VRFGCDFVVSFVGCVFWLLCGRLFVSYPSVCLLCCGCMLGMCSVKGLGSRLFKVSLTLSPLVVHCYAFWYVLFVFVLPCLCFRF